ncbi:type II toxin-antitoxin system HicB family antitoxin [Clostridium perfringens]|uniref:Toxin-antitoxin system, antitoxin component, HicB domain protein n=1 Tax=Clostridium perfringens TaxID=1502 RepID=A0A133MRR7_CLOPF|nr:type II toxin-antitoxin system HicB family antitoxin [Clostridium perfringens]KXA06739.1 toxin-antitoxin system, antitoxin component, HicB domain protein [Clostridium perfringens]MBS5919843.1 type II toxin-antitoxin system HicB family antitoxin [Clostridium perfringens]MDK0980596.1 toxin-antitoxin system HicB family antitoxin [Clostridium perfringens]MDU3845661.1 toxin-antitoxin system HicB family antitoxin [Clostridium perfringens]MDU7066945.1 toxin-antitoxin system HicB family antitoxin [
MRINKIRGNDYKVELIQNTDEGGYLAYISQLDCWGDGETPEEAYNDVVQVADDIIKMAIEDNIKIPVPNNKIVEEEKCSGKLSLRIPKTLHAELIKRADKESCSINQLMNMYLSMGIGMEYGKEKFTVNIEYKTNEVQESLKKDSSNWIKNIEKNLAMKGVI